MEFSFDPTKTSEILADYTVFHPTLKQLELIFDISDRLAEKIGLSYEIARQLNIKAVILFQQEVQRLHYLHESNFAPIKVRGSERIFEIFLGLIFELLIDGTEEDMMRLKQIIDELIQYYIDRYAMR